MTEYNTLGLDTKGQIDTYTDTHTSGMLVLELHLRASPSPLAGHLALLEQLVSESVHFAAGCSPRVWPEETGRAL